MLPLRCARSPVALPAQLPSMRVANFSTSVRRQLLNSDVRITRYGGVFLKRKVYANTGIGPESRFCLSPVDDPRSEVRNSPHSHTEQLAHTTTGYTATVFGATGFLGRYVVNKLGA